MKITLKSIMELKKNRAWALATVLLLSACTPVVYQQTTPAYVPPPPTQVVYVAPAWAPPYNNVQQVQYYFLPDIDVYYNAYSQQFVYYDGYNWVNSQYLPPAYSSYDLNSAYVVYLDYNTYNPWVNNQVYVEHYPRYYYNTYYSNSQQYYNNQPIRGYNENARQPIYAPRGSWKGNQNNNSSGNSGINVEHPNNNTGNSGIGTPRQNGGYYNNAPQQNNNSGNSGIAVPQPQNNTGNSGIGIPQQQNNNQGQFNHDQYNQQQQNNNQGQYNHEPANNNQAPQNNVPVQRPQQSNTNVNNNPQTQHQNATQLKSKNVGQPVKQPKPTKKVVNNKPVQKNPEPKTDVNQNNR